MSYPEVEVPASWIESNLDKKWLGMESVINIEEEPGIKKGENFGSAMRRVKITGLAKDGTTVRRDLIMKKDRIFPAECVMNVFNKEILMYTEILPKMKQLIDELSESNSEVKVEVIWPICFGVRNYDVLLFEDLKESGFIMRDRTVAMSLNEATFVISHLAKFHALSLAAINRKMIDPTKLSPYLHTNNEKYFNTIWFGGLTTLADVLESDEKWSCLAPKVRELASTANVELNKLRDKAKGIFDVVCHGDCHTNNMLFKFSEDSTPSSVMFLDYQMCHYNCFAWDLIYLFSLGFSGKERHEYCEPLIEKYRFVLIQCLEALGQNTSKVPTVEQIHDILDQLWLFGFMLTTCLYPVLANTTDNVWDGEKAFEGVGYSLPRRAFEFPLVKESLKIDLPQFKQKFSL